MSIQTFSKSLTSASTRQTARRRPAAARLRLEPLEDRCLLSNYSATEVVLQSVCDLNNQGQVAGQKEFVLPSGVGGRHAVLWQNGTVTDLGSLGTFDTYSVANAVGNAGHVAGYSYLDREATEKHAFLVTPEDTNQDGLPDRWFRDTDQNGVNDLMTDLDALGGAESFVYDVNASGWVVGETQVAGPYSPRAFLWRNGVMTDLGTLGGTPSGASAINDAGQVIGSAGSGAFLINPEDSDGDGAPDRWYRDTNGDGANDLMVVLPGMSSGSDINATGQVVGDHYLWTPDTPNGTTGTLTDLGTDSYAYGLNGAAQVVGSQGFGNEDGWIQLATLWEGGVAVDLNTRIPAAPLGLGLTGAGPITDQGWMLATTYAHDSNYTSTYLLTPDDQPPPPVPPTITIGDVTVTEGNTGTRTANFTVTLSAVSSQPVTVAYATANGTATAGSDYQAASGTLTIPAGQTAGTITVLVIGDRLPEPNETFVVNLSSPTNATITDGQGVCTIVDDEPRISITDVSKYEGKKGQTTLFAFTVTLSAAYDQAVTMSYATANGTAKTSDSDYVARTGTLTFAPGETTKTITIEVKGDSKKEANETFYLDLFGNSLNLLFTKNRGLGTILNDD